MNSVQNSMTSRLARLDSAQVQAEKQSLNEISYMKMICHLI